MAALSAAQEAVASPAAVEMTVTAKTVATLGLVVMATATEAEDEMAQEPPAGAR